MDKTCKITPKILQTSTQKVTDLSCSLYIFSQKHKYKLGLLGVCCLCLMVVAFPDAAFATKLEDQLDSANSLITDKVKKYGILGASIAMGIWSIFKGNVKQAGVIVGIGIILSYYLGWVEGGMKLK